MRGVSDETTHVAWREANWDGAVVRVDSETWRTPEAKTRYFDHTSFQPMSMRHVWAMYDATGRRVHMGRGMLEPSAEELAVWDAEAPARAAVYTKPTGLPEAIYIRFNRPPRGGYSRNHATGEPEAGVSVYAATYNRETERIELEEDGTLGGAALNYIFSGATVYLLTGEEVGRGSDGEPLIRAPKSLGTLTYDLERGGFRLARRAGN